MSTGLAVDPKPVVCNYFFQSEKKLVININNIENVLEVRPTKLKQECSVQLLLNASCC